MTPAILCPHCAQWVDPQRRVCDRCGVDLAVAVAVAEQSLFALPENPSGVPLAPEMLVPRMGETMIARGLISEEDLQKALDYQKERSQAGETVILGQALLILGLIEKTTLDEVITQQIMQLHAALRQANQQLETRVAERTRDLQNALDRLSELNQLKTNFIANISHELRTPLTHIKGYSDLMLEGSLGPLTGQQSEALNVLQRAELRLERLIEDLIQFSLAARGEFSLNLVGVRLQEIIPTILSRYQSKAEARGIELRMQVASALPPVWADYEKISWALSQLVDNALKFTPQGGRVSVSTSPEGEERVLVTVQDTGIGIPEGRLAEIFEAFHQLDGSATRRYGGTGLGLALVQKIVEAHQTGVLVTSEVGKGSCFQFSLPVFVAPRAQSAAV